MTVEGMVVLLPGRNVERGRELPVETEAVAVAETDRWQSVRADYDAGMLLADIYTKHRISSSQLTARINKELWPRRNRSRFVDRSMIITRMFRVLERQVMDLEMEMADMTRRTARSGEKEVVLLGKLAGTLDKLMNLDGLAGEGRRTKTRTKQMKEIHHKLIERIEQLKRA
jgi:hypothetical protein